MAFGHGKNAVLKLANVAGSTVDISQYTTSVDFNQGRDEVDITALGASYKNFLGGIQDASFTVDGIYDPAIDAQLFALGTATGGYWEYAPQGTATGSVKFSGSAQRNGYDVPTSVSAAVTWKAVFHVQGAVTRGTY